MAVTNPNERVTVRCRLRDKLMGNDGTRTRSVLDDYGLADALAQGLGDEASPKYRRCRQVR